MSDVTTETNEPSFPFTVAYSGQTKGFAELAEARAFAKEQSTQSGRADVTMIQARTESFWRYDDGSLVEYRTENRRRR